MPEHGRCRQQRSRLATAVLRSPRTCHSPFETRAESKQLFDPKVCNEKSDQQSHQAGLRQGKGQRKAQRQADELAPNLGSLNREY